MLRRNALIAILLILFLPLMIVGCKKAPPETTPEPEVEQPAPPPEPKEPEKEVAPREWKQEEPVKEPVDPGVLRSRVESELQKVYFDFDRSDLDDTDRAVLRSNAEVMKDNPSMTFVIEGHCDERGTIEYNLALGERRANSVRDYLVGLGIPASRLRIKSYGEERPAVPGSNEAAWAKNRRAEFKVDTVD